MSSNSNPQQQSPSTHAQTASPQSSRESSPEEQLHSGTATINTKEGADTNPQSGAAEAAERKTRPGVRYLRACDNCRRRKVKCDGGKPSCKHCNRVDATCHYSIKPKSRRVWKCLETPDVGMLPTYGQAAGPSSSGSAGVLGAGAGAGAADRALDETTARLLARVETMERLLMQRGGGMGTPRAGSGLAASGADDVLRPQSTAAVSAGVSSVTMADIGVYTGIGAAHAGSGGAFANDRHHTPLPLAPSVVPAKRGGSSSGPISGDTLGHAGQQQQGSSESALPGSDAAPHSLHGMPNVLNMPIDVVKDLIDTLFSSNGHMAELLHEKTYRRQFAAGTLSPLLLYASLASAARYSKNPAVRSDPPYSASAQFLGRAKTLVVDAIEEPSLGNAQGLMIMCMMHFSLGNEVVTTSYKALAMNMCILLGFNRLDSVNGPMQPQSNCTHDFIATSSMSMDWVDREAARRLWWTIFSIENYSSVCMGLAPSVQAEYCDVNLPASSVEWTAGKPNPESEESGGGMAVPSASKRGRMAQNPLHQLAAYHAQLSLIFSKVAWLVTRTNSNVEDAVAQFAELNSVLQRWYEGLPKELRLSSVDTLLYGHQDPSEYHDICVLHMRFYTTVIQLNHAIPEFTDDPAVIEPGQRKCVIAASRVSDLLRSSFEIPVEYRDMNWYMCVFRAAHIHIYRLLSRDSESIARAKQDLAIHRRHLREGGPLWRICYKLLSRLDDMEQMVMLLPAQIPVADLIRLKNLTRKGKSQLVNMQLDALIKPSLIQTENGDSDDLPLLARATMANQHQHTPSLSTGAPTAFSSSTTASGSNSLGALLDSPASSTISNNGQNSSQQRAFGGDGSGGVSAAAQHVQRPYPFATIPPQFGGLDMSHTTLPGDIPQHMRGAISSVEDRFGVSGGGLVPGQAASSSVTPPSLPALPTLPTMQLASSTAAPSASVTAGGNGGGNGSGGLPSINTNIVIDNNMAETLVNYFYMVASNQSPSQGNSTSGGSDGQMRGVHRSGSEFSLNSPQLINSSGSSGTASILPAMSPIPPVHAFMAAPKSGGGVLGGIPQQHPQQPPPPNLIGRMYGASVAELQTIADGSGGGGGNGSGRPFA
ncbi:hypothetical protein GGI07_005534 [Coemansia sp. Benny D115]|nr:hypothetical protein GGI07_005534 [Coemansia sp. Benny D115]